MQISFFVLGKATRIAKEHSINKMSIIMIVGKFKIMRPEFATFGRVQSTPTKFFRSYGACHMSILAFAWRAYFA